MTKRLTPEEKTLRKRAKLRDKYRETVCPGCRSNRYNYQSDGERPGIDAPTTGHGCWVLGEIKHGKCPGHSDYSRRLSNDRDY